MTNPSFSHLTEDRVGDMIRVLSLSRQGLPHERSLTRDEAMVFTFNDPDFDPKGTWLVESGGEAIGFAQAGVESSRIRAGKSDGYLDVDVVPGFRGEGTEEELLDKCIAYLRSRGVKKALGRSQLADKWKTALLSKSFKEFYRVYWLVREGRTPAPDSELPTGFSFEEKMFTEMSDGEVAEFVQAHNEAFFDHLNSAPEDPQRIIKWRDSFPDPIRLSWVRKGDTIAGVCMSEESVRFNKEQNARIGWIDILGVKPEFRRRGLARAMLADGVNWILGRGMDAVYIGVISANEKALVLYLSLGFRTDQASICYELPLGRAEERRS